MMVTAMMTIGFQRARSMASIWASDIPCARGASAAVPGRLGSGPWTRHGGARSACKCCISKNAFLDANDVAGLHELAGLRMQV